MHAPYNTHVCGALKIAIPALGSSFWFFAFSGALKCETLPKLPQSGPNPSQDEVPWVRLAVNSAALAHQEELPDWRQSSKSESGVIV